MLSPAMARSTPVTLKFTDSGGIGRLDKAVSPIQRYREQMEDANLIRTSQAVDFCIKHLHAELLKHEEFLNNLPHVVQSVFLRMDGMLSDKKTCLPTETLRTDNTVNHVTANLERGNITQIDNGIAITGAIGIVLLASFDYRNSFTNDSPVEQREGSVDKNSVR
ncbi:hypothetical protein ACP70R_037786 [Stipagrostis hirtigluma subsp. patula]